MKEHPILFSGEMVRAILAGRKTVTRRLNLRWARVKAGEGLWVRETHSQAGTGRVFYRADDGTTAPSWTPSIHMPRDLSRVDLVATEDGREERLQDITEEEADAEGFGGNLPARAFPDFPWSPAALDGGISIRECFAELWDAINGKRATWKSNPPVARLAFRMVRP